MREAFILANPDWKPGYIGIKRNEAGWLQELRLCYDKRFRAGPVQRLSVRPGRRCADQYLARPLTPVLEEGAQQSRRLFGAQSPVDFRLVQRLRVIENARTMFDAPAFRVAGAVVQPVEPGMRNGSRRTSRTAPA